MKLKHIPPAHLVGCTIIDGRQLWRVDRADEQHVHVGKPWNSETSTLTHAQFASCRLYPSGKEVEGTYPRLLRALRWSCLLTAGEATSAIHGYITMGPGHMGAEAVDHVGGALKAIQHAIGRRHIVQRQARRQKDGKAAHQGILNAQCGFNLGPAICQAASEAL